MFKLELASFTDVLQIALTLVGFCFVIYSIVQVNRTLRVSAHTAATVNLLELDKLFIENPEYWPYFHRGTEMAESDERYFQLLALADFVLDYFQALLQQAPHAWASADTSQQFIKEMFKSSPILCLRLLEWKERDWTDRGIYKLAETSPLYQEYMRKMTEEAPNTADRADENRKQRGSRRSSA